MKNNNLIRLLALIFSTLIVSCSGNQAPSYQGESPLDSASDVEVKKANWVYEESVDKMSSAKVYRAFCLSTNEIEFDFPYNGGSNFDFEVRKNGKNTNIMLDVSKGQFIPSFGNRSLRVKFDDEEPMLVPYSSPSDGSSDLIFLRSEEKLVQKLKKAKKMMIEAEFYASGNHIIEFDVEGFEWQ